MKIKVLVMGLWWLTATSVFSQINISVDLSSPTHRVSPYLYGKNNSVSDDPSRPLSAAQWQQLRDAGVMFLRESGGNNSTKYNWRRKLSSHPDWYNNVYFHDWDYAAKSIQENLPQAQGMWSFQLIGRAAKSSAANFNDWGYNSSAWWPGVHQNLAGGGVVQPAGGEDAIVEGNPDLYLESWPADSTVGILDHWFGPDGIGLSKERIRYWNMDNEPEIWSGTHDDVMPQQLSPEDFMQLYFQVAKKARAKFPDIRLVGPLPANEWQWYNWANVPVNDNGKKYPWLEFFIKRVAEEQVASGIRLLDVLDIHFYPTSTTVADVVQYHRVYFDKTYDFPEHNGVHNINGNWDPSQTKEYILQRCREWLDKYMGTGHGVTLSVSETGIPDIGPDGVAVWYASTLGEFMRQPDMEIFAPWYWYPSMWEVLHLFSRYNHGTYVSSVSGSEGLVSAYPTINDAGDSLTVVLVNRSTAASKIVSINFNGFSLASNKEFQVLTLDGLSSSETFHSATSNALKKSKVSATGNSLSMTLPALSVVALQLSGARSDAVTSVAKPLEESGVLNVFPNPAGAEGNVRVVVQKSGYASLSITDLHGRIIRLLYEGPVDPGFAVTYSTGGLPKGIYLVQLSLDGTVYASRVVN